MSRANRNFGDDPTIAADCGLGGFAPGQSADFAMTRIVDGHDPFKGGAEGNNQHWSGAGSPMWDDPVGVQVEDD